MRLVNCEYTLDKSKVIFNFTSDDRVDFRKLVKVLAQKLKTRIELRQIGVRDEAKLLGGIGPCGRSLCCSTFLGDFEPVSIKMAKDQNLSLNPTKISGACGRLMCCLKYENDYYEEARAQLPDVGDHIETPEGNGKVVGLNILDISMQIKVEGLEQPLEYKMEELEALNQEALTKLNRSEIFEKLAHLESNINQINNDMVNLKHLTVELIEENVALQVENENLKTLIDKEEAPKKVENNKKDN